MAEIDQRLGAADRVLQPFEAGELVDRGQPDDAAQAVIRPGARNDQVKLHPVGFGERPVGEVLGVQVVAGRVAEGKKPRGEDGEIDPEEQRFGQEFGVDEECDPHGARHQPEDREQPVGLAFVDPRHLVGTDIFRIECCEIGRAGFVARLGQPPAGQPCAQLREAFGGIGVETGPALADVVGNPDFFPVTIVVGVRDDELWLAVEIAFRLAPPHRKPDQQVAASLKRAFVMRDTVRHQVAAVREIAQYHVRGATGQPGDRAIPERDQHIRSPRQVVRKQRVLPVACALLGHRCRVGALCQRDFQHPDPGVGHQPPKPLKRGAREIGLVMGLRHRQDRVDLQPQFQRHLGGNRIRPLGKPGRQPERHVGKPPGEICKHLAQGCAQPVVVDRRDVPVPGHADDEFRPDACRARRCHVRSAMSCPP